MKLNFSKERASAGAELRQERKFSRFGAALMAAGLMLPFGCAKKAEKEPERKAEVRVVHLSKPLRSLIVDALSGTPRICERHTYEQYDSWTADSAGTLSYGVSARASVFRFKTSDAVTGRAGVGSVKLGYTFTAFLSFRDAPDGVLSLVSLTCRDSVYRAVSQGSSFEARLSSKVVPLDTFNAILARATGERASCEWPMRAVWVLDHDRRADCHETSAFAVFVRDSVVGGKLLLLMAAAGENGSDGKPLQFGVQGLYNGGYLACGWGDPLGIRWDAVVFLVEPGVPVPDLSALGVKAVSYYSNERERDAAYRSGLGAERMRDDMKMRMSRSAGGAWKN